MGGLHYKLSTVSHQLSASAGSMCLHPGCSMLDSLPHKFDQLGCHILRRADVERRFSSDRLQGDVRPGDIAAAVVRDYGIGTIKKFLRGGFEVGGCRVQHRQVKVRAQKAHYRVGFDDGVLGSGEFLAHARHGLSQHSLTSPHPKRASCATDEKADRKSTRLNSSHL